MIVLQDNAALRRKVVALQAELHRARREVIDLQQAIDSQQHDNSALQRARRAIVDLERAIASQHHDNAAQIAALQVELQRAWAVAAPPLLTALSDEDLRRRVRELVQEKVRRRVETQVVAQLEERLVAARSEAEAAARRGAEEERLCEVCFERGKDCALSCGHQFCMVCSRGLAECPTCRVAIKVGGERDLICIHRYRQLEIFPQKHYSNYFTP